MVSCFLSMIKGSILILFTRIHSSKGIMKNLKAFAICLLLCCFSTTTHAETVAPDRAKPPGIEQIKNKNFEQPYLDWWKGLEHAPGHRYTLDVIGHISNATNLTLIERIDSGAQCHENIVLLSIWHESTDPAAVKLEAQRYEGDCCPNKACERTPSGWMIHLRRSLDGKDKQALSLLIDPERGVKARVGSHSPDESEEENQKLSREDVARDGLGIDGPMVNADGGFQCEAIDKSGQFNCRSMDGGYQASYLWQAEDDRAFLLSIDEESH